MRSPGKSKSDGGSTRDLSALIHAFGQRPGDGKLFEKVRHALEAESRFEDLAQMAELHAPHEREPLSAAVIWCVAGHARLKAGQDEFAEQNLREALALDPGNETAVDALTDLLLHGDRFADAAAVLERAVAALGNQLEAAPDPELAIRLARKHQRVGQIFEERLARSDRALHHYERAWQLDSGQANAMDAARAILSSFDESHQVRNLYERELSRLETEDGDARHRRSQLEVEFARLLLKDPTTFEDGIGHLERAAVLTPDSTQVIRMLADAHASPQLANLEQHRLRASELYGLIGQRHLTEGKTSSAITDFKQALLVAPMATETGIQLETLLSQEQQWEELDRLYRQKLSHTTDPHARQELLCRLATLCKDQLHDREGLKGALEELAVLEGHSGTHTAMLEDLYREDQDWEDLAALLERQAQAHEHEPARLVDILLALAAVLSGALQESERAAELLHRILILDPCHREATESYAKHFRDRRDWYGLADLMDFSAESLRERGAPLATVIEKLEELAQLCEVRLGDNDRAIAAWQRIEALDPHNEKAGTAVRRLISRSRMWQELVFALEREATTAQDERARLECLRRIAQVYRERQIHPRRAIRLYEEILAAQPDDEDTLKALVELYEREGDHAGLAASIFRQLDREVRVLKAQGLPTPMTWPVAKRVERLTALRTLASMYEDRLADIEGVVFACGAILDMLPGDREALERMERVLEHAGDTARLEQTLVYHAAAASGPAEKARLLGRLARLAGERGDLAAARDRWNQVLDVAPNNRDALLDLAALYEREHNVGALANVLERIISLAPRDEAERASRLHALRRYAQLIDAPVGADAGRVLRAWRAVLEAAPGDSQAMQALIRSYREEKQWRELDALLESQIAAWRTTAPSSAAPLALERAEILELELGDLHGAIRVLEQVIAEMDPKSLVAHQRLRRLYEARGHFDSAVRIAEREMFLTPDHNQKVARGHEIGILCRDRLKDPQRALQAFERVLSLDEQNLETLKMASELYRTVGDWQAYAQSLARLLMQTRDAAEQRTILFALARTTAEKLEDPPAGLEWLKQALQMCPDASVWNELEVMAETHSLWPALADLYEAERSRLCPTGSAHIAEQHRDDYRRLCQKLARVADNHLGDPVRALDALFQAIQHHPGDASLVADAERIAARSNHPDSWRRLLGCLEVVSQVASFADRAELHLHRARIRDVELQDLTAAIDEVMRAFSFAPDREDIRSSLYALCEKNGDWTDAVAVESALCERTRGHERQAALKRRAELLEHKILDRVRAFRIYIQAFLCGPEDEETIGQLWRLAREIGEYTESQRTPHPEPPAAYVAPPPEPVEPPSDGVPRPSRRARTEPIGSADLVVLGEIAQLRAESTKRLKTSDLIDVRADRPDKTMELSIRHLVFGEAPPLPVSSKGPPPPPFSRSVKRLSARGTFASTNRPAPPERIESGMPVRPYESPWDELCTAYLLLRPAQGSRLRYLFEAAEVWEVGGRKPERAFDVLAEALRLDPQNSETRRRLRELAAGTRAWDRLASLYQLTADGAGNLGNVAELLREAADIRREQGQMTEAEAIYRRVLGMRPEDHETRDRLEAIYREDKRWVDLAASLEERTDPRLGATAPSAMRPALLRELVQIYGRELNRPRDAVDALERLCSLEPDDADALEALACGYRELGSHTRVVSALQRVAERFRGEERGRQALYDVARIYERELELPDRAIFTYDAIAREFPNDVEALEALSRLYAQHEHLKELADVLGRRAALTKNPDERRELHTQRARLFLGPLDRPEEAISELRLIRESGGDARTETTLIAALRRCGRIDEAMLVIEERIERARNDNSGAHGVAPLLVELAELKRLSDVPAARQLLEQALREVPEYPPAEALLSELRLGSAPVIDLETGPARTEVTTPTRPAHIAAIFAHADSLEQIGDYEELSRYLDGVIRDNTGFPNQINAELKRRLAIGLERTGQADGAYHQLLEADRIEHNNFLTKLALGQNRFRQKRWREAALHLSALGDLPGATGHPALAAEGLYQAALAEIRALRADRAEALLERAVEFQPDYRPALQALAERAQKRGDHARALHLYHMQANAARKPADRQRLFEALAKMAEDQGDIHLACESYEATLQASEPIDHRHIELLTRLLRAQEQTDQRHGAARTAERLATLLTDQADKARHLVRAADHYLAAGDPAHARSAANQAHGFDPHNLTAAAIASELEIRHGEFQTVATILGRALSRKVSGDETTAALQALLWSRLGDARLERGDRKGARTAFETALHTAPDADGAVIARRRLLKLLPDDQIDVQLEYRRFLATDTHDRQDIVDYARTLEQNGQIDAAFVTLELARELGHALDPLESAFLQNHPKRPLASDESYAGIIGNLDRDDLLTGDPGAPLLQALWEAAPVIWADPAAALRRAGLENATRMTDTTRIPAATMFTRIAQAMGTPATVLYQHDN